jgi:hypothetical protein
MKIKTLAMTSLVLLAASTALVFAGPVCDINNANNPSACNAKVTNLTENNVPFTLVNVNPNASYQCTINIEGSNAEQVSAQNMQGENGVSITVQGRTTNEIPFEAQNASTAAGMITFNMHSGRKSVWKNESNTVYVICNKQGY